MKGRVNRVHGEREEVDYIVKRKEMTGLTLSTNHACVRVRGSVTRANRTLGKEGVCVCVCVIILLVLNYGFVWTHGSF